MSEEIKLTAYSHGSGCGCKIAPHVLDEILKERINTIKTPNLLVGLDTKDDAAVYQLNLTEALIATTDFFTPIVNDAYIFGQVAAANALSDVYAMGGEPILALAILGWPVEKLPLALAQQVMEGAQNICQIANIPLAGGHSIDSTEPIFGLSVNGIVNLKYLKQNNKAQAGDLILLTKPIGVGILATAAKREIIEIDDLEVLHQQLIQLNSIGKELGKLAGVHAMTDVTGFGLAGHLIEMAESSSLSVILNFEKVPKIEAAKKYLAKNIMPDATFRNWKSYNEKLAIDASVDINDAFKLLPDPQTNGGLLIAVAPNALIDVQKILLENGYTSFCEPIGLFIENSEKKVLVRS